MFNRLLAVIVLCLLASINASVAAEEKPTPADPTWRQAWNFACKAEGRVLANMIPMGVGEQFVHFALGVPNSVRQSCGTTVATAIHFNKPSMIRKSEFYYYGNSFIMVSYRCDDQYRDRAFSVKFYSFK